jgi:hypothetical protein
MRHSNVLARASNRESAAILAIALVGASLLVTDRLPAQETHTFSNVIELGDGRVAAADATLIDDSTVSFMLMAPGLDLEWVEIRDRQQGGTLLATTRSTRSGRPPHLQLIGMGEVLNEAGADVTIGLEDFLVELTLHAPGGGLGRTAEAGVVVVGFTDGQSTSFPILSGDPADEAADGAMITMAPGDDADEVFGDEPGPPEVVRAPAVEGRSGAAVGRTDAPAPSEPAVTRPPAPAPAARTQPPPVPTRAPQVPGPVPAPGPGPVPGPGNVPGPGAGPGSQGPAAGSVAGSDWLASATALRGRNGERFEYRCPAGGAAGRGPFGTDVYADHSSVCTAAVHAGLVTFASGGSVTIEIRAGQDFYAGSPGHGGVTSFAAGGWPGSFAFVR